jgi:dTDP-4-amino-4,6-dideoxygalactose transaminase
VALARRYRERLADVPGLALLDTNLGPVVPHLQPVRVLHGRRDALLAHLTTAEIQCGLHYKPNHLLALFGDGQPSLPITERLFTEILSLPLHPGLNIADVDEVCTHIEAFFGKEMP